MAAPANLMAYDCPQPLGDGATLTDGPKPEKYDRPAGCIYITTPARAIVAVLFTAARGQLWAMVGNGDVGMI